MLEQIHHTMTGSLVKAVEKSAYVDLLCSQDITKMKQKQKRQLMKRGGFIVEMLAFGLPKANSRLLTGRRTFSSWHKEVSSFFG